MYFKYRRFLFLTCVSFSTLAALPSNPSYAGFEWTSPQGESYSSVPAPTMEDNVIITKGDITPEYNSIGVQSDIIEIAPPISINDYEKSVSNHQNETPLVLNPYPLKGGQGSAKEERVENKKTEVSFQAPLETPKKEPVNDYNVVNGFGRDLPMAFALSQIVPSEFAYSFGDGVDPGMRISWSGGKSWPETLHDALIPYSISVVIVDHTVMFQFDGRGAFIEAEAQKKTLLTGKEQDQPPITDITITEKTKQKEEVKGKTAEKKESVEPFQESNALLDGNKMINEIYAKRFKETTPVEAFVDPQIPVPKETIEENAKQFPSLVEPPPVKTSHFKRRKPVIPQKIVEQESITESAIKNKTVEIVSQEHGISYKAANETIKTAETKSVNKTPKKIEKKEIPDKAIDLSVEKPQEPTPKFSLLTFMKKKKPLSSQDLLSHEVIKPFENTNEDISEFNDSDADITKDITKEKVVKLPAVLKKILSHMSEEPDKKALKEKAERESKKVHVEIPEGAKISIKTLKEPLKEDEPHYRKKPSKLIRVWQARQGNNLQRVMEDWSAEERIAFEWKAMQRYKLDHDVFISGTFKNAINILLKKGLKQAPDYALSETPYTLSVSAENN